MVNDFYKHKNENKAHTIYYKKSIHFSFQSVCKMKTKPNIVRKINLFDFLGIVLRII